MAKIIANTRNTMQLNQEEPQSWEEVNLEDLKCSFDNWLLLQKADEIQICDSNGSLLCKSGTSSPNLTLRKNRSGSDAGIQVLQCFLHQPFQHSYHSSFLSKLIEL